MLESPQIVTTQPRLAAGVRINVPRSHIREVMGPGLRELMSTVATQGIQPTGPWFTYHHRFDPENFDLEICVPVSQPVRAMGRVEPLEFPSRTVARTVYLGPYEGLAQAWGEFMEWVQQQGHTLGETFWECYLEGPEATSDPRAYRTELNRTVTQPAANRA